MVGRSIRPVTKNTCMKMLFEFLKDFELVKRNRVNVSIIASLTRREIYKIVELLLHLTETQHPPQPENTFIHSASQSLAGRWNCTFLLHRLAQLDELGRFAAFYSDAVYVENFFLDYEHFDSLNMLREMLHDDLWLLLTMKPLMETGRIQFFTPEIHSCINCFNKGFGDETKRKIERGYRQLAKDYLENSTVSLIEFNRQRLKLELDGPEPFYEHPMVMIYEGNNRIRDVLKGMPRLLSQLENSEAVRLSSSLANKLQVQRRFASTVANSATFGILSSKILRTSFLTDNPLDISFLRNVTNSPEIDSRNQVAFKYLTSMVPFVGDVRIRDLLKLRKREEEAFLNFRKALNQAISEFRSLSSNFSEKDARQVYSDVIQPRLAALDKRVSVAKRDLLKKGIRSVATGVGIISFGLYSGLFSGEIAELIKTLGLAKIAYDVGQTAIPVGEAKSAIKTDDLYFLWKAKKLAK